MLSSWAGRKGCVYVTIKRHHSIPLNASANLRAQKIFEDAKTNVLTDDGDKLP